MRRTGFIDHIGIGVPDLVAAKQYYDDLMSVLGLREWFETSPGGPLNYGPDGAQGSQLFFYKAGEPGTYSRSSCLTEEESASEVRPYSNVPSSMARPGRSVAFPTTPRRSGLRIEDWLGDYQIFRRKFRLPVASYLYG